MNIVAPSEAPAVLPPPVGLKVPRRKTPKPALALLDIVETALAPGPDPVEQSERRADCRYRTVYRVAKVVRRGRVGLWCVRNISDNGMMLLTRHVLEPDEPLSIALSETLALEGKVVWCKDGKCGVEFDRAIDCAATLQTLAAERLAPHYRPLRLAVRLRGTAYCERGIQPIRITDISQQGIGFTHDGCFQPGMRTLVCLENGLERRGIVRWSGDSHAGLMLLQPFTCAELDDISEA